ncbi:hypothetical protein [Flammeovirga sp. SJP92]|uniref:hypothetical protein n=1 Tax=Flammeovirga sp. SJP92 TaxID=1775430 RepID=UPI0007889C83|nr:hypothetical protein [Flammeovirga sp. SJP92]KXX71142.1 hypothetical protein AVL50_09935 [Flammeovirga sp. SJP92]
MKYILILLALISLSACIQDNKNEQRNRLEYVIHPNPDDTLCISEIERAKRDIENGKIVFTQTAGFLFGFITYEAELRDLCKLNGLEFDYDLRSCVVYEGQSEGCYGDYMDKIIIDKYGIDFKENLHKKAESLYQISNQLEDEIVQYLDCDIPPRLPNETKQTSDYNLTVTVNRPNIKEKKENYGGWPFFDIGFTVEKDSTMSGFHSIKFMAKLKENKKYKDELFEIAVKHIKAEYPIWIPGEADGKQVRSDVNVRVIITKKE